MPELPEIVVISRQMERTLKGKTVATVSISQPKMLNRPMSDFMNILPQKTIVSVQPLGKWTVLQCKENYRLLINLGMGGEIIYFSKNEDCPPDSRAIVNFSNGSGFFIRLWWFGYFHLVGPNESHPMTDTLGPDPLCLSETDFLRLMENRKGQIKPFLLNQKNIRGIGNFYIQEILYRARLHPLRPIPTLTQEEKKRLHHAIQSVFQEAIDLGGSDYEKNFWGGKRVTLDFPKCPLRIEKRPFVPVAGPKLKKFLREALRNLFAQYVNPGMDRRSI